MSNIAGPYTQGDFRVMQMLKDSLRFMKKRDAKKYEVAINMETDLLKERLNRRLAA